MPNLTEKHATPVLAVDAIIERVDLERNPIVLIERKNQPYGWALPGGMVEVGESCESACIREALEETSLHIRLKGLLGVYSAPDRDPRGHVVSVVYVAEAMGFMEAKDDATEIRVIDPTVLDEAPSLAFDHRQILAEYYQQYRITFN